MNAHWQALWDIVSILASPFLWSEYNFKPVSTQAHRRLLPPGSRAFKLHPSAPQRRRR
jgi:hypothetical protein